MHDHRTRCPVWRCDRHYSFIWLSEDGEGAHCIVKMDMCHQQRWRWWQVPSIKLFRLFVHFYRSALSGNWHRPKNSNSFVCKLHAASGRRKGKNNIKYLLISIIVINGIKSIVYGTLRTNECVERVMRQRQLWQVTILSSHEHSRAIFSYWIAHRIVSKTKTKQKTKYLDKMITHFVLYSGKNEREREREIDR